MYISQDGRGIKSDLTHWNFTTQQALGSLLKAILNLLVEVVS
jgi:hypothetical protein